MIVPSWYSIPGEVSAAIRVYPLSVSSWPCMMPSASGASGAQYSPKVLNVKVPPKTQTGTTPGPAVRCRQSSGTGSGEKPPDPPPGRYGRVTLRRNSTTDRTRGPVVASEFFACRRHGSTRASRHASCRPRGPDLGQGASARTPGSWELDQGPVPSRSNTAPRRFGQDRLADEDSSWRVEQTRRRSVK